MSLLEGILTELRVQNSNPEGLHAPAPVNEQLQQLQQAVSVQTAQPAALTTTTVTAPPAPDFMAVAQAAVAPTPNQTATAAIITREAVGNALIELATANRDMAVAVLSTFGAKKLGEIKEADYPKLLGFINEAILKVKAA